MHLLVTLSVHYVLSLKRISTKLQSQNTDSYPSGLDLHIYHALLSSLGARAALHFFLASLLSIAVRAEYQ